MVEGTPKTPFQIVYHRAGCIECGACAKLVPDFWTMNPQDNKANLIGGKDIKSQNGMIFKQTLDVQTIEPHWIAFEICPIKVIKLYDTTTKQLIELRKEFNKEPPDFQH